LPASVDVLLIAVAAASPGQALLTSALSVIGSALGSLFLFSLARKGGQFYLDRHASSVRALLFRAWFARYGLITIFIPALVPIVPLPLKVFVLSAGALGVPPLTFLMVIVFARLIRYFGLAWLGMRLGADAWPWLQSHGWHLAALAIGLLLALGGILRCIDGNRRPSAF
jgi:membrane protein YqaA with SNARE-associated domain